MAIENNIKLSVVMITYGHEHFIEQAIRSVLSQVCNFRIELFIANDNSPDETDSVISKIIADHPNASWINYINRTKNIGMMPNLLDVLTKTNGEFIALCDGDDYWIDNYKLQKQVDILETNPDYSLCFHNAKVIYESSNEKPYLFNAIDQKKILNFDDLIQRWQIATGSMVFRNLKIKYPEWFVKQYNGDMALQFLCIGNGPFVYLEDLMSVYRIHGAGVSNRLNTSQLKNIESIIGLLNLVDCYYNGKYRSSIENYKMELTKMMRNVKIKNKYPLLQKLRISLKKNLVSIADKL